jgi:hypothetical protein
LGNLTNKTLERELANQEVRRLLITTNFTELHVGWLGRWLDADVCSYHTFISHQMHLQQQFQDGNDGAS